ncbi:MAG: ligase-associated DNA damage response exonuclease [Pseudomonadota bacterium]
MVLEFRPEGIYCPAGDFFIDPWRPVDRALITHGHADHSRWGMKHYLATEAAAPVMRHRLGDVTIDTIKYAEPRQIGNAKVSFHPAGHVPGSAQIRVEVKGEVWVASGDYKTVDDGVSEAFTPVPCHAFISESTFGLPVFTWDRQEDVVAQINAWWQANRDQGRYSIIGAYALGKAQRILAHVDASIGPILTHGAIENTNDVLRGQGISLPETIRVSQDMNVKDHPGALVIATPSAMNGPWARKFGAASTGFASGWMAMRGVRRRRSADRGFVMSDHADWEGLNAAIKATGAERVFVTHGYTSQFRRWLCDQGYDAKVVETEFEGETLDAPDADPNPDPGPEPEGTA